MVQLEHEVCHAHYLVGLRHTEAMCLQHVDQVGLEVFGHVVAEYAQTELIRLPLAFDRLLHRLLNQVGGVVGHGHGLQVG